MNITSAQRKIFDPNVVEVCGGYYIITLIIYVTYTSQRVLLG